MKAAIQLDLNFTSSTDVRVVRQANGEVHLKPGRILVEGTVKDARRVLGGVSAQVIHALIAKGEISAYKPNPAAANSKFRVEMATVYSLKARQKLAANRA